MFVTADQLQAAFGVVTKSKLKETLADNNVRFFTRRDGLPFTTMEALNSALGLSKDKDESKLDTSWMDD